MNFEKFFRLVSYAVVFCGFLTLVVSGTFGPIGTGVFSAAMIAAWKLEDTRWQISEKLGTFLILLALPAFYILWKLHFFNYPTMETALPGILARLVLTLTAIKLLQKKSDRDWIFLYLMAFFEVLLAAGLSISALYLASFITYLLVMVCAIVAFEIRKTTSSIARRALRGTHRLKFQQAEKFSALAARRLPITAIVLILLILIIGTPLFFLLPRVSGAGLGGNSGGVSTSSGFSDTVRLGGIGRIQQNDEVVMRIRIESGETPPGQLRWRGVALDTFNNLTWSKSRGTAKQPFTKDERDLIQIDYASGKDSLITQTFYLEPLDTPVLFGLARIVAVQGNFSAVFRDADGSVTYPRGGERTSYKVVSDPTLPAVARLRADDTAYGPDTASYVQLPDELDPRIAQLGSRVTSGLKNRYDKAKAVESYLQDNFGYTLELKAGGSEPLADFLFNVREGHCEYFATAMAVMLRTQGIATRIVNGFQEGDYNQTADVYVVRQRHAHSWVEVYFPKDHVWVPFDPTPAAGRSLSGAPPGILGTLNNYMDALQTFWIQYFVAFDNQEQQSLARSARKSFFDYQARASVWSASMRETLARWWANVRGDQGPQNSLYAIGYGLAYLLGAVIGILLIVWLVRKIVKLKVWQRLLDRFYGRRAASIVEFYDRMLTVLASKGFTRQPHQTPLEFAFAVGMPEAVNITEKYNRVRFGARSLSDTEASEIENWLDDLEFEGDGE